MKIYRRVVPKIAKDIVRSLLAEHAIEIEDGHRDEAELDVAGTLVAYLNEVDQLKTDAQEALSRHKLGVEMLGKVKQSLAQTRNIPLGKEAEEHVLERIIEGLFSSKNIEEIFAEDNELRVMVRTSMSKYVGVDAELDREVRNRLKNLREGTSEWELEYGRLINQMRSAKALQ